MASDELQRASAAAPEPAAVLPYTWQAIEVNKPLKKAQQIGALLCSAVAWGELSPLVFVGTTDGSLHCYVPSTGSTQAPTFLRWHMTYKKIYHACAQFVDAWGVYITIADTGVVVYALPLHSNPHLEGNAQTFGGSTMRDRMVVVEDTKQAVLMDVHEDAKVVCIVTKQNVLKTFDWTRDRTLELRAQHKMSAVLATSTFASLASALSVQRLVLLGESFVLLLFKKDWCVVNVDTGLLVQVSETCDASRLELDAITSAVAVSISPGEARPHGVSNDAWIVGKQCALHIAVVEEQQPEPFASSMELRVVAKRALDFSKPPCGITFHHPFLLVDVQDKLVVYNGATLKVVQTLPMKAIEGTCISKTSAAERDYLGSPSTPAFVFAVTAPFAIQMLQMKRIKEQVRSLIDAKQLEDAVSLIELCPNDAKLRSSELKSLYAEFGMQLFRQARFERAMEYFFRAGVDVMEVLHLYPHDLLPRSRLLDFHPDRKAAATRLVPASTLEGDDLAAAMHALLEFLWRTREAMQEEARGRKLPTRDARYHQLVDTVVLKCLVLNAESSPHRPKLEKRLMSMVQGPNDCDIGEVEVVLRAYDRLEALLAFYSARQLHPKAIELLEDMERNARLQVESTRMSAEDAHPTKPPSEATAKTPDEYKQMTAEYLRGLGAEHADLVFEYSQRIIASSPALGLSIFTQRKVDTDDISPAQIMAHLQSCRLGVSTDESKPKAVVSEATAPPAVEGDASEITTPSLPLTDSRFLAIEYVTQVIMARSGNVPARVHDDAVYLMLDAIAAELQNPGAIEDTSSSTTRGVRLTSRVESQRGIVRLLRQKLLEFLEFDGAHYHPERMLSRTPKEMVDERATLLSRLGRHHDVLQLYATELRDASLAEAYCNKVYEAHLADSSIYSTLLRLYLRPSLPSSSSVGGLGLSTRSGSPPKMWRSSSLPLGATSGPPSGPSAEATLAAIAVLNKYAERIDVATALDLLPPEVPVQALSVFFSRVLERRVEQYRNGQVKKQLSKMENFKVRDLLTTKRKESVTVWSSHCCEICGKKLGTSTFVRLPGGSLVHYSCQPAP